MQKPFPTPQAARRLITSLAACLLATCELCAAAGATPSTEAPKPLIVFVGADILADFGGKPHHVIGANAGSVEILSETKTEIVPMSRVDNLRAVRGVKLSTLTASIEKIRAESLSIAFNNEQAELGFSSNSAAVRNEAASVEIAKSNLRSGDAAFGRAGGDWAAAREKQVAALDEKEASLSNLREISDAAATRRTDNLGPDNDDRKGATKPTAGQPALPFPYDQDPDADGLTIKAEISSPAPLEKAYLAVNIRYVDPRTPRRILQRVALQPISRLDKKPRKVSVSLRGLPQGFHLVSCEVDLYANGQEVTTNLSGKQMVMTEEQVYQYFFSDHLSRNRSKTCPPAPLLLAPPGEVRRQVDLSGVAQEIYAQVDKQGSLVSLSTAEDKLIEVTPQIQSVMHFVRFLPGLENGEPAEGHVKFRPADLLQ